MQFLKTLFWVVLAIALVLFATINWVPVTVNLWGGLEADVKLPVLVFAAFLLGFLPMFLIHRTRIWTLKRRLGAEGKVTVANSPGAGVVASASPEDENRIARDSKAWPAA